MNVCKCGPFLRKTSEALANVRHRRIIYVFICAQRNVRPFSKICPR